MLFFIILIAIVHFKSLSWQVSILSAVCEKVWADCYKIKKAVSCVQNAADSVTKLAVEHADKEKNIITLAKCYILN